jgi:hypothetical protein
MEMLCSFNKDFTHKNQDQGTQYLSLQEICTMFRRRSILPWVLAVLLAAVAMMAAGWDGAPDFEAPGFPKDGNWVVRHEGLFQMP